MSKHRNNTIALLARAGISTDDARALCRAERVLHTWAEHECNGAIQRDETTGRPYWHSTYDGRRWHATSDREAGALRRVAAIVGRYGLAYYHQTDPRGCALYVLRPGDVPAGADVSGYYSRGLAVVS